MHRKALTALLGAVAVLLALIAPSAASAWAPANTAPVHPGVQTNSEAGQCTSNFIFQDANGVYIGQAAHCTTTGGSTSTNGCETGSLPLGTPVQIGGASRPGTLVYNSWLAMQAKGETDADTCAFNDLALVKIDPADVPNVNPSVPAFGGPTGVGTVGALGDTVYTYGNSSLRLGITKLSPKQGLVIQNQGNGWSHVLYTVTPGIPGDSGSGFLNASGQAVGVLSTLQVLPLPGSNGVGDLQKEIDYLHQNSSFTGTNVVPGTEPFRPDLVQAILKA